MGVQVWIWVAEGEERFESGLCVEGVCGMASMVGGGGSLGDEGGVRDGGHALFVPGRVCLFGEHSGEEGVRKLLPLQQIRPIRNGPDHRHIRRRH